MIKIGKYNRLRVSRTVDFGVYLDGDGSPDVLLPARYVPAGIRVGDEIEVFVYTDSDDRPVATTERPLATVGEFAYLKVRQVNRIGAFLDWGLPKDLLVPFGQQRATMHAGGTYLVYVYLDDASHRVVATARVEQYVGNVLPDYKPGDEVEALIIERTDIGYKAIVDKRSWGMLYHSDLREPIELRSKVKARVRYVRPQDGKIDLVISERVADRVHPLASRIIEALKASPDHSMTISDSSDPAEVRAAFGCSKRDFKRAIGLLYREHRVALTDGKVSLV